MKTSYAINVLKSQLAGLSWEIKENNLRLVNKIINQRTHGINDQLIRSREKDCLQAIETLQKALE